MRGAPPLRCAVGYATALHDITHIVLSYSRDDDPVAGRALSKFAGITALRLGPLGCGLVLTAKGGRAGSREHMNLLRQFLHLAASAAALLTVSRIAWAQAYPSRPITLIVPIAADGGLDTRARILSEKLQEELRQPLIVENRPGAGSTLGSAFVADLALGRPPRSLRECSKQPT